MLPEFSSNDFESFGGGEFSDSAASDAFTPSAYGTLALDLDPASLALVDDARVDSWPSSAADGHTATAAGDLRPTYKTNILNGLPIVRFNGVSGQWMSVGDFSSLTAGELFLVRRINNDPPVDAAQSGVYSFGTSVSASHLPFPDGTIYDSFGTDVRKTTVNPATSMASWHIYSVYSAENDWANFLNGVQIFSTGSNTVGFRSSCLLGTDATGSIFLDGDVGRLIIYNAKLSTLNRSAVIAGLKAKYGVA